MTITYELENQSSESAESVDIKPMRTGWSVVSDSTQNGGRTVVWSKDGDTLTRQPILHIHNKPNFRMFHAADGKRVMGREYLIHYSTHVKRVDSVAGELAPLVLNIRFAIQIEGSALPDRDDVLQTSLSVVSLLYNSVTTGVPDSTNIAKVSIGDVELV